MRVFLVGSGFSAHLGYPVGTQLWAAVRASRDAQAGTAQPMLMSEIVEDFRIRVERGDSIPDYGNNAWRGIHAWANSEAAGVLRGIFDTESDLEIILTRLMAASGALHPEIACLYLPPPFTPERGLNVAWADHILWVVNVIVAVTNMFFLQQHLPENYETDGGAFVIQTWIERALQPNDTVVTTNYDLVLEHFLWNADRWNPNDGCAMPFEVREWDSLDASSTRRLARPSTNRVLKLHGSAGWYMNRDSQRPYLGTEVVSALGVIGRDSGADPNEFTREQPPLLVHPGYTKKMQTYQGLQHLWFDAHDCLAKASHVCVIGCGFPAPDELVRTLLVASLRPEQRVTVIDPSPEPTRILRDMLPCWVDGIQSSFADWVLRGSDMGISGAA